MLKKVWFATETIILAHKLFIWLLLQAIAKLLIFSCQSFTPIIIKQLLRVNRPFIIALHKAIMVLFQYFTLLELDT